VALDTAYACAKYCGVSFALGAFVVGQSDVGQDAGEQVVLLRDAFAVLFFISVGMLIEPAFLLAEAGRILVITAIVVVGKTIAAFLIVLLLWGGIGIALVVGLRSRKLASPHSSSPR
jgi:CPA2 family monovalent cation:H+ antiporter-2